VLVWVFCSLAAPALTSHDPFRFVGEPYLSPGAPGHVFGTDHLGRDMFSRVIYGSRTALLVGLVSAGISALLGILIGAAAGYFGGVIDDLISRSIDVFLMIPVFFLLILATAIFGSNINFVTLAIGLTIWPSNARIMRSQVLTLKTRPYVLASTAAGASPWRLLFTHIIPNGIFPVTVNSALQTGSAMLTEAGLSFLGLGDPNIVSWGQMVQLGQRYLNLSWTMVALPGLALLSLVAGFSLVGDGLTAVANPRLLRGGGTK